MTVPRVGHGVNGSLALLETARRDFGGVCLTQSGSETVEWVGCVWDGWMDGWLTPLGAIALVGGRRAQDRAGAGQHGRLLHVCIGG